MTDLEEIRAVERLGKQIGYGNLMEMASALWRRDLKKSGAHESGAFIPTLECNVIDISVHAESKDIYDSLMNRLESEV